MSDAGGPTGAAPPPPPSVDPDTRVCARCGRPATDKDFCVCGANLEAMRGMLPTRGEWEAANPEKAAVPPPEPPPPGQEPTPHTRPITWEGVPLPLSERMRKQIIPSIIAVAIFAAIVIFGSRSSSHKTAAHTASTPSTVASTTHAQSTTHPQTTSAKSAPTLTRCATAWNGGRSATHRHILDLIVAGDHPPVAVIATYAGPERRLARVGGGSQVLVRARACVVIAHHSVFLQQPNETWGFVKATPSSPFATVARVRLWTRLHHNASVTVGPLHGGPANVGAVTPRGRALVMLRGPGVSGSGR